MQAESILVQENLDIEQIEQMLDQIDQHSIQISKNIQSSLIFENSAE